METVPVIGRSGLKDQFASEILVLGSGITGLCAASLFASSGQAVRVLEAHPGLTGGHARTIQKQGYRFSSGPQYVWGFGHGQIGWRLLDTLGLAHSLPFRSMDPDGFERLMVVDNATFDVPMGLDRFCEKLVTSFPKEEPGLREFFTKINALFLAGQVIFEAGLYLKSFRQMLTGMLASSRLSLDVKGHVLEHAGSTLEQLFNQSRLGDPVRRLLFGHSGLFAENETDLPAFIYAAATGLYHAGASVPAAGFDGLLNGLIGVIRKNGELLLGKKVVRLIPGDRRIQTVQCQDGSQYTARTIISTLSPRLTQQLLPVQARDKYGYTPSNSFNTFLIGVKDYPQLLHALHLRNIWWQDGKGKIEYAAPDDTRLPQTIYLGSPTANGIHSEEGDPARQALIAFSPGSFSQSKQRYLQDPSNYAASKEELANRMLGLIDEKIFPGFLSKIELCECYTPWDVFQELGAEAGNAYGRRLTLKNLLAGPPPQLPFENLHIACASVGLPGIASAFQTAAQLFFKLSGRRV